MKIENRNSKKIQNINIFQKYKEQKETTIL